MGQGLRGRVRVSPSNPKSRPRASTLAAPNSGPGLSWPPNTRRGNRLRALLVHGWQAWSRLACMSTWRAAESPTHASTPECSQEYRDGPTAESGWGEALPAFHGPKLGLKLEAELHGRALPRL